MSGGANSIGFTAIQHGAGYLRFQFTDILGRFRSVQVPRGKSNLALSSGVRTDGSSIPGISEINDSDRRLIPDRSTHNSLVMSTKSSKDQKFEFVICNITNDDGSAFAACPRTVLKKVLDSFDIGIKDPVNLIVGAELEFFLFKSDEDGVRFDSDNASYYDNIPHDHLDIMREDIIDMLQDIGIDVDSTHHEVAKSQHEITLSADRALAMADKIVLSKWVIRNIAAAHGYKASFMPKPVEGMNGSGLHLHHSICSADLSDNYYYDSKSKDISKMAKKAIGGILRHADAIAAFTNPTVNSYKRLVPGFEAPTIKVWGKSNRSAMIRVPSFDGWRAARVEFRMPDASANPYLAIAALASSVQDGICSSRNPPKPVVHNVFEDDDINPELFVSMCLEDSLASLYVNDVLRLKMGNEMVDTFISVKREEILQYNSHVGSWEIDQYIDV